MDSVGVGVGVACVGVDWSKDLATDQLGGWRTNRPLAVRSSIRGRWAACLGDSGVKPDGST